jgi:beta-xylosidase
LKKAETKILLSSSTTLAAPSIAYYDGKYYLLVEAFVYGKWNDQWVTLGYVSDKADGDYKEVNNEPPVLYNNDACAFQYVLDGQLYITYSHCLDLAKWNWELRMVKAEK